MKKNNTKTKRIRQRNEIYFRVIIRQKNKCMRVFFSPNDKRNEMNYVYKYIEYSNKPTRTYQHILITLSTSIHPSSVPNHPPSPAYKYNTLRNVCQLHLQKSDLRKKIVLLKRRIIQPKPHNGIFSRRNNTSGVR